MITPTVLAISILALDSISAPFSMNSPDQVTFSTRLDSSPPNDYYVGHRTPLRQSPFQKLPIGAIRPQGWLRKQLELQAEGFSGRLPEISKFLDKEGNAWLDPSQTGRNGWEEVPYWLKGQADLGFILNDSKINAETKPWIEAALQSQREDGWFGPESNLKSKDGKPDLWPNMIMLFVLQSYYEHSGDKRVLDLMTKYFKWQLALPEAEFLHPPTYWHYHRGGDNLISVLWLYNRTGDAFLLDLAKKLHRHTADWTTKIPDPHGVNFAQAFREPATFSLVSKKPSDLEATERDLTSFRNEYGQFPGGMYGADENVRKGFGDPRQAAETCAMVEIMFSHEYLLTVTGDPKWADRCEDVAFNSLPASMTPDLKGLRYLTAANHILSDRGNKYPGISNTGPMYVMDPNDHRCCQHNVAQGWPYFAEHLWLATAGNGLAAVLYAPSEVTAKVGDGTPVTITQTTDYPFRETIEFKLQTKKPNAFPLSFRVPNWVSGTPKLTLNGKAVRVSAKGAGYITVDRKWTNGDTVTLQFPAEVTTTKWKSQKGAISVSRGPLSYSLKIGEKYVRSGGTDAWPAYEIHPTTAWNYGLPEKPEFEVVERPMPRNGQPFEPSASPIVLRTTGRKVPNWKADHLGLVGELQKSPASVKTPKQSIELIPMGAARLRITVFPTVATGNGNEWEPPQQPKPGIPASASFVNPGESLDALSDQMIPKSSYDQSVPRMTWWDHKGTTEWVQYDFTEDKFIGKVEVYWYDDTGHGECRVPESWRILYLEGDKWIEAKARGSYGTERDKFNAVELMPFRSSKMRLEVKLKPGFSGGILEWRFR